jgi:hypothetical protein
MLATMLLQIPRNPVIDYYDQDEASMSSTVTVDRSTSLDVKASSIIAQKQPTTARKQVRFCLAKNESNFNLVQFKEETKETWYEAADYRLFKNCAFHMAKEITKAEEKNRAPYSYSRVMTNTYLQCCKADSDFANVLTPDEAKHLTRWAEVATSRLGLEKWSIHPIGTDKNYRRSILLDLIMDAQDRPYEHDSERAAYIADSCQRVSRPLRLFARTLAEAQATAALRIEE